METVYLIAFFLGLGFAVLSGLLSGVFGGDGGDGALDAGGGAGGGPDVGGAIGDVHGGHIDVQGGANVHFPLLSPVTISTFIASFGGMGVIGIKVFEWPAVIHVPVAAITGVSVAGMVFYVFYKIFGRHTVSSAPTQNELLGLAAEVTISIPKEGAGQIAYVKAGTRYTGSARTADGSELPQGSAARIERIVGGVFFVRKS
jgi:hypothetical protein